MRIITCAQGSPEWHAARAGVITASRFADACRYRKDGKESADLINYRRELVREKITGRPAPCFTTKPMQRGTDLEPLARAAYEMRTGSWVQEVGFVTTDCGKFGCSPDGWVGDDGAIEIKCPLDVLEYWETGDFSEYLDQVQGGLWITGRQWCDLVIYDPELADAGLDLLITRINRDEPAIAKLQTGLVKFELTVQTSLEAVTKNWKKNHDQH